MTGRVVGVGVVEAAFSGDGSGGIVTGNRSCLILMIVPETVTVGYDFEGVGLDCSRANSAFFFFPFEDLSHILFSFLHSKHPRPERGSLGK